MALYGIFVDGSCCHKFEAATASEAMQMFLDDCGYETRAEALDECAADNIEARPIRRDYQ